jgi:hypothetical protein
MRSLPVAVGLSLAAPLSAQTLHYEGSAGLATGTYIFAQRTSSWSINSGLAFGAGPVTFRAALPVFYQNTTLVASTGSGFVPTGGSSSGAVADSSAQRSGRTGSRRAGVVAPFFAVASVAADPVEVPSTAVTGYRWAAGDPYVSATLSGPRLGRLSVMLGVSAKAPVVDTASYGTGAWDVGGSLSLAAALGTRVLLGADVGYWVMGDAPGLELDNTIAFGGNLAVLTGGGLGLSAGVSGATPTIDGFTPSVSAVASVLKLAGMASFGLLATVGLTETAPDVSVALTWRVGLIR